MRLLLPANDEAMVFLNPLILDNVPYRRVDEIRKNMDHFLHMPNSAILLNTLKVKRIRYDSESSSYSQGLKVFLVYKESQSNRLKNVTFAYRICSRRHRCPARILAVDPVAMTPCFRGAMSGTGLRWAGTGRCYLPGLAAW